MSLDCDFFQGFLSQGIFFQGVNLQSLPFSRWQTQNIFQVQTFFSEEGIKLSKLRLNSRGFMRKQLFFPGFIGFKKFGHPYPCMDKKYNSPFNIIVTTRVASPKLYLLISYLLEDQGSFFSAC